MYEGYRERRASTRSASTGRFRCRSRRSFRGMARSRAISILCVSWPAGGVLEEGVDTILGGVGRWAACLQSGPWDYAGSADCPCRGAGAARSRDRRGLRTRDQGMAEKVAARGASGKNAARRAFVALAIFVVAVGLIFYLDPARLYRWIKAIHVIAVIAWMAGMLYLPRLFVYHSPGRSRFAAVGNSSRRWSETCCGSSSIRR